MNFRAVVSRNRVLKGLPIALGLGVLAAFFIFKSRIKKRFFATDIGLSEAALEQECWDRECRAAHKESGEQAG